MNLLWDLIGHSHGEAETFVAISEEVIGSLYIFWHIFRNFQALDKRS
ncbi:hypothetical protein E1A91_A07G119200v1 [Gossypium mustelinum]|uniref:Uncharacterized protein n=1 Tax=Gossypium mustelinum TaxID=34275 RepID=A0A5D2YMV9_GOSMU|nr:hypothetical protein E1A91_A07G119200v1 [Gossypium mustelinum]